MKKIKVTLFVILLSLVCALGLVACGQKDTPQTPTEPMTVTLSKTTLDLERHEEFTLIATVNNGSGTVYWSVDGTAVACSDGVVRGVSEGKATVTATCGDASATCAVTVTDTGDVPLLTVDRTTMQLQSGSSLTVNAQITYKGNPVTTGVLIWESGNTEVIAVTPIAGTNSAEIKAVNGMGKAYVTVSGSYNGVDVSERIEVEVVNDIVVQIDNITPVEGKYVVDLILANDIAGMDPTELDVSTTIGVSVFINGKKSETESAKISFVSQDDTIAAYHSENKTISAVGVGSTKIVATYTAEDEISYTAEISVNVSRPRVRISARRDIELTGNNAGKLTLGATLTEGDNVVSVKNADTELLDSATGNSIQVKTDEAKGLGYGDNTVSVYTDKAEYVQPICIVTRIISDKTVLDNIFHCENVQSNLSGYYVLGGNIDYGAKWETVGTWQGNFFAGTLDGRGYAITGVTLIGQDCGFFNTIAATGVVKNLAFTNVTYGENKESNSENEGNTYGGIVCENNNGTVSNIYIEGKLLANGPTWVKTGMLMHENAPSGKVSNCFVAVTEVGAFAGSAQGNNAAVVGTIGTNRGTATNVVAVGVSGLGAQTAGTKEYANYGAFKSAESDLSGWDESFWKTVNGLLLPIRMETPNISNIAITNTETTVAAGATLAITYAPQSQYAAFMLETAVEGVSLSDNTLTVEDSVESGTKITVIVYNVYNDENKAEKEFVVLGGQTLNDKADIELYGTGDKTISLSNDVKNAIKGTFKSVQVKDGDVLNECSYNDGGITLQNISSLKGEVQLVVTFEETVDSVVTYITTLNIDAVFATRILDSKEELDEVFHPNGGITAVDLTGYYVLGGNIDYNAHWATVGGWDSSLSQAFKGTLDGRGFKIDGVTVKGGDAGFFNANKGTIKNLVFTNAVFGENSENDSTYGGFLCQNHASGVIKNVYIECAVYAKGNTWADPAGVICNVSNGIVKDCFVRITEAGTHVGTASPNVRAVCGTIGKVNGGAGTVINVISVGLVAKGTAPVDVKEYSTEDFANVTVDIATWDSSFWTLKDGVPTPKTLAATE